MPTPDSIASLCGSPRAIHAPSLGRTYLAWPLRLRDIGEFEGWMCGQLGDPVALVDTWAADLGRGAREFAHRVAALKKRELLPVFGSPLGEMLAGSRSGVEELLRLSVRRGRPRFGRRGASRLYDTLGSTTARGLARWAIWGHLTPDLPSLIPPSIDPDDELDRPDFWRLFHSLSTLPGWSTSGPGRGWRPDEIAELTLPQLRVLSDAKPPAPDGLPTGDDAPDFKVVVNATKARKEREEELWYEP